MTPADVQALEAAMVGAMMTKGVEIHKRQSVLDKRNMLEEIRALRVA